MVLRKKWKKNSEFILSCYVYYTTHSHIDNKAVKGLTINTFSLLLCICCPRHLNIKTVRSKKFYLSGLTKPLVLKATDYATQNMPLWQRIILKNSRCKRSLENREVTFFYGIFTFIQEITICKSIPLTIPGRKDYSQS